MILGECWGACYWLEHWISNPRSGPSGSLGHQWALTFPGSCPCSCLASRSPFQPSLGLSVQQCYWYACSRPSCHRRFTIHAQAAGRWAVLAPGWSCFSESPPVWCLSVVAKLQPPGAALWPEQSQGTFLEWLCMFLLEIPLQSCGVWLPWAGRGGGLYGARPEHWLWCNSWSCHGRVTCLFALLSLWHRNVTQEACCKVSLLGAFMQPLK